MSLLDFISSKKKENILIFGTGAGGVNLYKSIKSQKSIIGFIDNNVQKQGRKCLGRSIYAPTQILSLEFDKIIIASDYYKEIYQQLTTELNICKENITIFDSTIEKNISTKRTIRDYIEESIKHLACSNNFLISNLTHYLADKYTSYLNNTKLYKVKWLDLVQKNKIQTFRKAESVHSYGPNFIGSHQKTKIVNKPEIALYQFKNAQIMTISGTIVLEDGNAIVTRVPSEQGKNVDFAAGHVSYQFKKKALISNFKPLILEKGIAITGANDLNYFHWILEVLSKIQFLKEMTDNYKNYPILISQQIENITNIKSAFNCLDISNPVIYLDSTQAYRVKDLLFITPPNYFAANLTKNNRFSMSSSYYSLDSLLFLRHSMLSKVKDSDDASFERIFLARKNFIRSYNQEKVENLLSMFDFKSIYLEDLSFKEQVCIINNAKFIIGPTGAAWTNLLFANKEVKALCWMAEEYGDFSCFSTIAKYLNISLDYISYVTGAKNTRDLYYLPYEVDLEKIKQWLELNINVNEPQAKENVHHY